MYWYSGLTIGKDPDSVLDYSFDWSDWLGADTISSHQVTADAGLTIDSSTATATAVSVWLSGGSADARYTLTCKVVTAAGRTALRDVIIDCGEAPGLVVSGGCA